MNVQATHQCFPWGDSHTLTSLLRNTTVMFRLLAVWCMPSCIREASTFYIFTVWLKKKKKSRQSTHSPNSLKLFQILFQRVAKPTDKAISSKCSVNNNIKCNSQMLVVRIIWSSSLMASCSHERDNYEMQTLWLGNTLQSKGRFLCNTEKDTTCWVFMLSAVTSSKILKHESIFMDSIVEILFNIFLSH